MCLNQSGIGITLKQRRQAEQMCWSLKHPPVTVAGRSAMYVRLPRPQIQPNAKAPQFNRPSPDGNSADGPCPEVFGISFP